MQFAKQWGCIANLVRVNSGFGLAAPGDIKEDCQSGMAEFEFFKKHIQSNNDVRKAFVTIKDAALASSKFDTSDDIESTTVGSHALNAALTQYPVAFMCS